MTQDLSPAERNTLTMADAIFGALSKPLQSPADNDGDRTRIGNYPTCDECGEQHSQDQDIECSDWTERNMQPLRPAPRYGLQAGRCITIDGTPAFTLVRTPIPDADGNGTHKLSPVELDCLAREIVALLNEPA